MTWIAAALASAAIMAVVAVVDSHLISKRMPSLNSFLIPAGVFHLGLGLLVLATVPLPSQVETTTLLVAVGSGIARTVGALFMLNAMRTEEVSRIMPVVHTFPIFVAILAVPLLGEVLGYTEWLSIAMTVAGAVLISIRTGTKGQGIKLRRSFLLLMGCSVLWGVANTASKYALDEISFWNMYSINAICLGAVFAAVALRRRTLSELTGLRLRNQTLALLSLNEGIAFAGIILSFWAMEQGPVSLVSTLLSTRPFFVFVYALVLGLVLPAVLEEKLTKGVALVKIVSIGLIVGGVTLLTLG
jgi:drug/metabolite transporter (DMT)-like permease